MIKDFTTLQEHCHACVGYDTNGHWQSVKPIETNELFGFIYAAEDTANGMWYIGRKHFRIGGKKTKRVNDKRVENRRHGIDSGWGKYSTSSVHVNKAIREHGIDSFNFYHLRSYATKGGLSYGEPNLIMKLDCLVARKENGDRLYYNNNVPAVRFIPKEY